MMGINFYESITTSHFNISQLLEQLKVKQHVDGWMPDSRKIYLILPPGVKQIALRVFM
jgi:hypothetical protein